MHGWFNEIFVYILGLFALVYAIYYFAIRKFIKPTLSNPKQNKIIMIACTTILLFVIVTIGYMLLFPAKQP